MKNRHRFKKISILASAILACALVSLSFGSTWKEVIEDFNNNANNWYTNNSEELSCVIADSKYKISDKDGAEIVLHRPFYLDIRKDFQLEYRLVNISTETGVCGVVWGMHGTDNYNEVLLSSGGYYAICNHIAGSEDYLKEWERGPVNTGPGDTNVVRIEKRGSLLTYYLNGLSIDEIGFGDIKVIGVDYGFKCVGRINFSADRLKLSGSFRTWKIVANSSRGYIKENLGDRINTSEDELCPIVSPDGKTLYFVREAVVDAEEKIYDQDIWFTTMDSNGQWREAENIGPPLNNDEANFVISVGADNNTLVVGNTYVEDGSPGAESGLSAAQKTTNGWSVPAPIAIDDFYNINKYVSFTLSQDGRYLAYSVERYDGYGDQDIYVSFLEGENHYTAPLNLGPVINTHSSEITPFLAADNATLYFSSYALPGYGSSDIFVSRRLDDTWTNWSEPENMGPEINSEYFDAYFSIPASGENAYMVSDEDSFGFSDIVRVKVPKAAKPRPVVLIRGRVLNQKNKEPLSAEIKYTDLTNNIEVGKAISDPADGKYSIVLQSGRDYSFRAEKTNYYAVNENLDVSVLTQYAEVERNLFLVPIETGQTIRLNNIFFALNKAELLSSSRAELDRLVEFLKKNRDINIEIAGHTDDSGDDAYNLQLSIKRAENVKEYLVSGGVDKSRLITRGYGKSKPILANDSEESRARNRRVEFTILKK